MKKLLVLYLALVIVVWVARSIPQNPIEGIPPDVAYAIGAPRLWPEGTVVEVRVWPDSTALEVGDSVQFFAATQISDGSRLCTDADAISWPPPWVHAGCDSAIALLAPYEPTDTGFVRFSWDTLNSARYDSLFYNLRLRSAADTMQEIDVLRVKHPQSSIDWRNGVAWTSYDVAAYAEAFFNWAGNDTFAIGAQSVWTRFGYPEAYPIPIQMGPVRVDTLMSGGGGL